MHDTRTPLSLSVKYWARTFPVLRHDGLRIAKHHGGQWHSACIRRTMALKRACES
jgi:hypothetical protein